MSGTRVIKTSPTSQAGIVVSDTVVRMNVGEDNGVVVAENGTTISGPVSFVSGPNHIRVGGLWTFNNAMALSIPSTMATPSAVLMIDPPLRQFAGIMATATVMIGLIGALGVL